MKTPKAELATYDPASIAEMCGPMLAILPVDMPVHDKEIVILRGFGHSRTEISLMMGQEAIKTRSSETKELVETKAKPFSVRRISFVLKKYSPVVEHIKLHRMQIMEQQAAQTLHLILDAGRIATMFFKTRALKGEIKYSEYLQLMTAGQGLIRIYKALADGKPGGDKGGQAPGNPLSKKDADDTVAALKRVQVVK